MATTTASVIGKRKRDGRSQKAGAPKRPATQPAQPATQAKNLFNAEPHAKVPLKDAAVQPAPITEAEPERSGSLHVQFVTGSYERVLHGVSASIPRKLLEVPTNAVSTDTPKLEQDDKVTFADNFLFAAHASAIRCLAVSPPTESDKRYLATGSTDERINVYAISTAPPSANSKVALPTLASNAVVENERNRSLGSLIHHERAITRLDFPAKGKLLSSAEDNTIAISRTRDWTVLSSIKAPIPKAQGRPSGDTAGPGEIPAGVNDFAIHPSQKLMLSVGRGERCLRLWNLMTGKKAGVLNFDRALLEQVGEGKYSSGEGRRVLWDGEGETYVVGFERGAAVFGMDSKPKAIIRPAPSSKLHQLRVVQVDKQTCLVTSTEDGRLLFFRLGALEEGSSAEKLPSCVCVAQVGGESTGLVGRIKDFEIMDRKDTTSDCMLAVTASSDGAVRLWRITSDDIAAISAAEHNGPPKQIGETVGTLETGSRITCLAAFRLDGANDEGAAKDSGDALDGAENGEGATSSDGGE
ncbi:hypothetical protein B0A50_05056 [Salinomyces thailandicus]|uniref:60S ribosome biogenesis protein Mak11 n=1 Tax=Salinomyces thailandicus TaxID=706561 RepID=A0A4U0TVK6_9PEZI|nr:hypothetical protein B0A50_05056 [Salinomyces thailandica]